MQEVQDIPHWAEYWIFSIFIYVGMMSLIALLNFYLFADREAVAQVRRESTIFNRQWMMLQAAPRIYKGTGFKVWNFLKGMLYGLFFLVFLPVLYVTLTAPK